MRAEHNPTTFFVFVKEGGVGCGSLSHSLQLRLLPPGTLPQRDHYLLGNNVCSVINGGSLDQ